MATTRLAPSLILLLLLMAAAGRVGSTEDIDGKSDLGLDEAKRSMAKKSEVADGRGEGSWISQSWGSLEQKDYWLARLFVNLLSYSTILVPCFLLVILVRGRDYLDKPGGRWYWRAIQLFVEGRDHLSLDGMNAHKSLVVNPEPSFIQQSVSLCLHGLGLLTSYLVWGLLQERVMVFEYHTDDPGMPGERFHNSQFIVFSNRMLAFLVAMAANLLIVQPVHRAPAYKYLYASFSNIMSSWCQYEALKFVSFPVQVLSKSSKVIPVMLMGKVVSRRSYSCFDYVTASAISLGIFVFLLNSEEVTGGGGHWSASTTASGLIILVGYLGFDSFTSNWQDELFSRYKLSSLQMMAGVNLFSILLTFISLLEQGTLFTAVSFMLRHPLFALHIFVLSLTSAIGQLFIFSTIARFGPATFTIIMTVRQGLAILLSCIIFGHQVTVAGASGVAIVFLALFVRIYRKQTLAKKKRQTTKKWATQGTEVRVDGVPTSTSDAAVVEM